MSYVYIATILLLLGGATAQRNKKILTFTDRITNIFRAKCLKNAGELEYKEVVEEFKKTKLCFIFQLDPQLSAEEISQCYEDHSKNITRCLTKFGEKLDPCLDPKEKYLKQFIIDAYNITAKDYHDDIQSLNASEMLIANIEKCARKLRENPKINPYSVCYKNLTLIGDHSTDGIITKEELCSDILQTELCFSKLLGKHCPDIPRIKEYQWYFAKAGNKHCTNNMTEYQKT